MVNDKTIRKQIRQAVNETDSSAMVILYGSRARGNATTNSDWDILILLDKPTVSIKEEQVFRHKLYDLELKIDAPISTFVYSLKDWNNKLSKTPLHQNIEREGIIL
ncbi:MAG: nucleotidyltransferase domain-containing protein [Chitinophagales bacterium]